MSPFVNFLGSFPRRSRAAASPSKNSRIRSTETPLSIPPAARHRATSTMRARLWREATSGSTAPSATTESMSWKRSASVTSRAVGSAPTSIPYEAAMSDAKAL